jgi:superoxide reductase
MLKEKNQIFKCHICGNIVEAVHTGNGELVCCGEPMKEVTENTQEDVLVEKHIPIVEKKCKTITVTVGSVEHPMDKEHYIEWIELISGPIVHRHYLNR